MGVVLASIVSHPRSAVDVNKPRVNVGGGIVSVSWCFDGGAVLVGSGLELPSCGRWEQSLGKRGRLYGSVCYVRLGSLDFSSLVVCYFWAAC